ncbi:MAG TPA: hypothetical protein EYP56_04880 [Planctomycetaceae bacterium]|nr:hypothetical protein [Planctomycetaceae bacterium]
MEWEKLDPETRERLRQVLGYLNFSSGAEDPCFLDNLKQLYARLAAEPQRPAWRRLGELLRSGLRRLASSEAPFRHAEQAESVLRLVFDHTLAAYRRFHRDLLFHQPDEALFQPFFLGRVCQAVLAQGGPWDELDRIVNGAIRQLNDFIGYRPVAVLETGQKMQPYEHEWVGPLPLYICGAGVVPGRYHDLVAAALEILRGTDPDLLAHARFDPQQLHELALDPRAFDFDHPVNKRPNYQFGGWDPHSIDNRGYYRRFVLIQLTVDAILERTEQCNDLPYEEVLYEAATVLAGTMLMGSGISGDRPDAYDSSVSLVTVLPAIAEYREEFYQHVLERVPQPHATRLRNEARRLHQPFGGARQDLNQRLARYRANQLQHVHLAQVYARMGHAQAAEREANVVPASSARMRCQLECRLHGAHQAVRGGQLAEAAAQLEEIEQLIHRGIHCGAFVDPWNILGFGGQFSLFPAPENSVPDQRVDDLIDMVAAVFELSARLQREAAAGGHMALRERLARRMEKFAEWWDQFATTAVSDVDGFSGREIWESTTQVSAALHAWHAAGTAAGDVAFWKQHVQHFRSPASFGMLVDALLEKGDGVAALALMMYWLSRTERMRAGDGQHAFDALALRWMSDLWQSEAGPGSARTGDGGAGTAWPLTRKFFDYLEANAESYWQVPRFELADEAAEPEPEEEPSEESDEEERFAAAYENVVCRDTTDDGFDGQVFDAGPPATDFELVGEAERLFDRLAFLTMLARLWATAAASSWPVRRACAGRDEQLAGWLAQALANRNGLAELLDQVHRYQIPSPRPTHEAMVEYDRRMNVKEALMERITTTALETADAVRVILASMERPPENVGLPPWERKAVKVLGGIFRGQPAAVRRHWPGLVKSLSRQPILYIPIARGGDPHRILNARNVLRLLERLLAQTPKLGLLAETYGLFGTIHQMERRQSLGPGAITEFDRLFEVGCRAILQSIVQSATQWREGPGTPISAQSLLGCMEKFVERLLKRWVAHSRNIRISVLETVAESHRWRGLKEFIRRYGHDLFTQRFMNLGNLRAILHQGGERFLEALAENPEEDEPPRLVRELGSRIRRRDAARWLELTVEAVAENYSEYIDYNSTTTQSDRGDMLYTLLDFLRLLASYERVLWNLRPVLLAHQVLVRNGYMEAAWQWRDAVIQRTQDVAEEHLKRLNKLTRRHAMRLASVADRVNERFIRPLDVDRACALVEPAIKELENDGPGPNCQRLEAEVARLAEQPSGAGFDLPPWLESLQDQVERLTNPILAVRHQAPIWPDIPQIPLSLEQLAATLEKLGDR